MITGRQDICQTYRQEDLVEDYLRSRYDDPFGRNLHERQARIVADQVRRLGVRNLLEIAPGPGRLTLHVPPVELACAVEQSPAMLRVARRRLEESGSAKWQLIQGDAFRLPFAGPTFDLVMTFKLVRHFPPAERLKLLAEARRVLRPGGWLLLDVANRPACQWLYRKWGVEKAWIDDFWFTPESFREEMRQASFPRVRFFAVQPAVYLQYYLWAYLWRLSPAATRAAARALEYLTANQPLEWLALCQCG